jgi:NADH-quinone oxidoreductase subunit M
MEFINDHILTLLIFLPAVFALVLAFVPSKEPKLLWVLGIVFSAIEFLLSIHLYYLFEKSASASIQTFEFMKATSWISNWNIQYLVGIDGVSLLLILLTTILTPIILLASMTAVKERAKGFILSMLVLETGMIGVFCALDLFLFYVFWEVMLVPMYLLIGIWGGKNKIYAAIKFFIYTMAGSVLMLVGILYLYFHGGETFNLTDLYEHHLAFTPQLWIFLAFALAFAIKVPLFPLHTWLPDAHVEAPTGGSVILAGVLLKMGTYGFFRFAMPLFPDALLVCQPYLITLAVIGIVYGSLVAMVQPDIKKLIAYSSVAHLGVVMLGLFALERTAIQGGLYQMLNHGVSTGALFILVGMIYERTHSREIAAHGGLAKILPWYTTVFLIVTLSSIGLPLTNGFVGEFLSLVGAFQTHPVAAIIGTSGVILSAFYMLWLVERFFFGKAKSPIGLDIKDLNLREVIVVLPFIGLIFVMGIYPQPFLKKFDRSIDFLMLRLEKKEVIEKPAVEPGKVLIIDGKEIGGDQGQGTRD